MSKDHGHIHVNYMPNMAKAFSCGNTIEKRAYALGSTHIPTYTL